MSNELRDADHFHALHRGPELLVLANAWDAGSALVIESLGARAIATTSAGLAWSHGYPDGEALPASVALATAAEITRVVRVPVSVNIEGGYSDNPAAVAELVRALIDVGVVGINVEDGSGPSERLCRKIEAVRQAASARGVELFINARTDVYLRELVAASERVAETRTRGGRYLNAGASGLFVPCVIAPEEIAAIARDVALPLNVMAVAGLEPAAGLARLGVRRLSAGPFLAEVALGSARARAAEFLRDGSARRPVEGMAGYAPIGELVSAGP